MTVMDQTSTLGFLLRIEAKDNLHCFPPVRGLSGSVQQAKIGHEMPLVIGRHLIAFRRAVVKGCCRHRGS